MAADSNATRPRVVAVFVSPGRHQPMRMLEAVRALEDYGLEGDSHARPGTSRQLLLMDQETLDELGLAPGSLKENVTTAGLDLYDRPEGRRLKVGDAVLLLTGLCAPCKHVDEVRPGLKRELAGRRGALARVVTTGEVRVGDSIEFDD